MIEQCFSIYSSVTCSSRVDASSPAVFMMETNSTSLRISIMSFHVSSVIILLAFKGKSHKIRIVIGLHFSYKYAPSFFHEERAPTFLRKGTFIFHKNISWSKMRLQKRIALNVSWTTTVNLLKRLRAWYTVALNTTCILHEKSIIIHCICYWK